MSTDDLSEEDQAALEQRYRETAIGLYANDECEFDDKPTVSLGDDEGAWVECWRWVPASELK